MYGSEAKARYSAVDISVVPCHLKETLIGRKIDNIPPNCNRDKDKLANYLTSSYNLLTLYNTKEFQVDKYGAESLKNKSEFH